MTEVYEVNRPAVLLHTLVAVFALAFLFQHVCKDYLIVLSRGERDVIQLYVKMAVPVATVAALCWSGWRRITRQQRLIVSVSLILLGLTYFVLVISIDEDMKLICKGTGVFTVILGLGLLGGEILGFSWLVHPWSVSRRSSTVMPEGFSFSDTSSVSSQCSEAMTQSFNEDKV